jgi:hypothetical protein
MSLVKNAKIIQLIGAVGHSDSKAVGERRASCSHSNGKNASTTKDVKGVGATYPLYQVQTLENIFQAA